MRKRKKKMTILFFILGCRDVKRMREMKNNEKRRICNHVTCRRYNNAGFRTCRPTLRSRHKFRVSFIDRTHNDDNEKRETETDDVNSEPS